MAEVAPAFGAGDLDAVHAVGVVLVFVNGPGLRRDDEAGPSAAGVELGPGEEEKRSAACTVVVSCLVILSEGAGEGALSAFFAEDVVLLGREHLAPFGFSAFHLAGRLGTGCVGWIGCFGHGTSGEEGCLLPRRGFSRRFRQSVRFPRGRLWGGARLRWWCARERLCPGERGIRRKQRS